MSEQPHQHWIIRYEGRIVYYPWSWRSLGVLSAYVVDSPRVLRVALRRRRRALFLAGFWAFGSLFWMQLSPVMLLVDAFVLYIVRRWELSVLSDSAVRLPMRLAVKLAADRQEKTAERLIQSILLVVASMYLLLANMWVALFPAGAGAPTFYVLTLLYTIADTVLLIVIWRLQKRSQTYGQSNFNLLLQAKKEVCREPLLQTVEHLAAHDG